MPNVHVLGYFDAPINVMPKYGHGGTMWGFVQLKHQMCDEAYPIDLYPEQNVTSKLDQDVSCLLENSVKRDIGWHLYR